MGMAYVQALAHWEIGRESKRDDRDNFDHLLHAVEAFAKLDAEFDLTAAQKRTEGT